MIGVFWNVGNVADDRGIDSSSWHGIVDACRALTKWMWASKARSVVTQHSLGTQGCNGIAWGRMNLAYLNPQGSSRFQVRSGIMPEVFAEAPSGYEELGFRQCPESFSSRDFGTRC